MSRLVHAIVLAGGPNTGPLREVAEVAFEAEVPVAGKAMVVWVVEALRQSEWVRGIRVMGPASLAPALEGLAELREPGATFAGTMLRSLEGLEASDQLLFVTGDVPLVTGPMIDRFVSAAVEAGADLAAPVVLREVCERAYPGVHRTYVRLREGAVTMGNLFLARPWVMPQVIEGVQRLYDARKNPLRLAGLFGPGMIFRLLTRSASLRELEAYFSRRLGGARGVAVVSPDPEIGIDVDKVSDWRLAEERLARRANA
ncbi:MAG: NTP transferase domain-containing protein [Bacillota bacterium]|nr:NTP transferase domain-containing protein [Bacillota bacterium]